MEVTKANLATYLSALAPSATPYPIEITKTIATDWISSVISGTVGSIIRASTPSGVYLDLGLTIIPHSVTAMTRTFGGCTSLITAPIIPSSVANMNSSFENCTSLTTAPIIPLSVTNMYSAFRDCTSLHTIQNFAVDVDNCDMTNAFYNCPALANIYVTTLSESSWHLLHTDTDATGTDYTIYNPDGTVAGSGTVAGTSQVLTLYGKSDELVISDNITPTLAVETAISQVQWHKSGLPYDDELLIFNAKNPDTVISNFITVNRAGEEFLGNSATATNALACSGNAGTADKWKTARNITISDADGTNTGTAVPVDGSENKTLKLPATIKATIAGKSKDSYPIPTDAVLQYSFDEIKQLPDNPTGTVYKKDNDWTTVDGWTIGHASITLSTENQSLKITYNGTRPDTGISFFKAGLAYNGKFIVGRIKSTVPIVSISYYNGTGVTNLKLTAQNAYETVFYGYMQSTSTNLVLYINYTQLTAKTCWIESLYIGDGSYLDPVIDNSYSESHAENHGVIPVDGVCGKAGYFNNSYMIAPRPALGDDITIYFWAKFDALVAANWQTIIQSRTVQGQGLSVFQVGSTYELHLRENQIRLTGYTLPVNTWHHVCIKMNDTTAVLKINGETKVTLMGTYGTTANLASTIWSGMSGIGGTPASNPLMGALDGLKIVPRFTTDDEDTGEYKARANHPKFYATADKWKTARNVSISDADGTNTGTAVSVDGSENETLKLPATIKANITGNASTADKWKTARNVSISDADGTNTGTAVSVDGSENETLKLPPTIKANLTGNATTASKANVRVSLRHGTTFFEKTWTGLTGLSVLDGTDIWTDRENIYLSTATKHFILNKATSTWVAKTWTGLTDFYGKYIWTDGDNIYNNSPTRQFVLNKDTLEWSVKTWNGLTYFDARYIWKDGENIYYSSGTDQYVLNKATSTWSVKTWTGLTSFSGSHIWTDGDNIYYSLGTSQYVLNKATATWSVKTWSGLTNFYGSRIWTDGENIYYSVEASHYVLNKATSTWVPKIWNNTSLTGEHIWTDGDNIYHDNATSHIFLSATRHNYVDDSKYNPLLGKTIKCSCSTLSDWFVFRNE